MIEKFKRDGVGGDDVFEETYVLQKMIAEYITSNCPKSGGPGEIPGKAVTTYNAILGIESVQVSVPQPDPITDPVVDEIIQPDASDLVKDTKNDGKGNIKGGGQQAIQVKDESNCLLYTSDAADE